MTRPVPFEHEPRSGAGPFGTLQLADLGAEIIRLEDPSTGGDVSRYVAPVQKGTDSLYLGERYAKE